MAVCRVVVPFPPRSHVIPLDGQEGVNHRVQQQVALLALLHVVHWVVYAGGSLAEQTVSRGDMP